MREVDKPFLMAVEDVFSIEGRGTVATGPYRARRGQGGRRSRDRRLRARVAEDGRAPAWRCSTRRWTQGRPATTSAACCAASSARTSSAARCWPSPARSRPHTKFEAEVYVLSKEEGGRHTPFFSGYRPQFYFRTTDVTGSANLLGDAEMCMPGDNVELQRRVDLADRHGRQRAVRHPRGRPDGRLRRGDQDPQVARRAERPRRRVSRRGRRVAPCDPGV